MNIPFLIEMYLIGMAAFFAIELLDWALSLLMFLHSQHCENCSTTPTMWDRGVGRAVASSFVTVALWPIQTALGVIAIPYLVYRLARWQIKDRAAKRAETDQKYIGAAGMTDGEES